jgi:bacteriocin-type transport-associated protein
MRKILYLLGQLNDLDLAWMLSAGRKERIPRGTVLIREGKPIEALYIILVGSVEVSGSGLDKANPIRLGCGEVVGEISFVDARPPSANVTTIEDTIVLAIPRAKLTAKLAADAEFAARFYRSLAVFLAHRLRSTTRRLGYGHGQPLKEDEEYEDELGEEVLDSLHMAGNRFDYVLQRLLAD